MPNCSHLPAQIYWSERRGPLHLEQRLGRRPYLPACSCILGMCAATLVGIHDLGRGRSPPHLHLEGEKDKISKKRLKK